MLNRKLLVKLHLVMAAAMLSITAMFFITGGLYLFDYKPGSSSKEYRFELSEPMQANHKLLKTIAHEKLAQLNIDDPSGRSKIKRNQKKTPTG